MLRPPTAHCLDRLLAAGDWSDRDLDRALCDVGVLPPVDLAPIRMLLGEPGINLSTRRNIDGHSIVEICRSGHATALIHHDGRIQVLTAVTSA
ncbi:MAG: hypothetical protein ABIP17_07145 [Ilumatobacteraceae bacterium]